MSSLICGPMDRRATLGTICATLAAGGIASLIGATALQTGSSNFKMLLYAGIAGIVLGFIGLIVLLVFPVRKQSALATNSTNLGTTIDQRVTSHGQIGGQTAHTIVNREPDPVPQRHLTSEQVAAIRRVLEGSKIKGSILEVQFASNEHARFSAEVASLFERCGWKRETLCIPSREKPHGMQIGWHAPQTDAYRVAIAALNAAGMDFTEGEFAGSIADMSLDVGILEMTPFQRAADKWPE